MNVWLDRNLVNMTPGYCDLRNQAETTAGKPIESVFETCMIYTQEHWKPAYSNDVNVNGNATVFIPSALIFSNGQVAVVTLASYMKLDIGSRAFNSILTKFGKGLRFPLNALPDSPV